MTVATCSSLDVRFDFLARYAFQKARESEVPQFLAFAKGMEIGRLPPGRLINNRCGQSGVALLCDGIVPGTIAIQFGYGHWELGAREHIVDGAPTPVDAGAGAGVNMNLLGFTDPTRRDAPNVWIDWVSGAVVRQGVPARIKRTADQA